MYHPFNNLIEQGRINAVGDKLPFLDGGDELRLSEEIEMMRNTRLRHIELIRNLACIHISLAKKFQNLPSGVIVQSFE